MLWLLTVPKNVSNVQHELNEPPLSAWLFGSFAGEGSRRTWTCGAKVSLPTNANISAMRPRCNPFLEEIAIRGVMYGSVAWRGCSFDVDYSTCCNAARMSAMRPRCNPFLEEIAIGGVIYGSFYLWGGLPPHMIEERRHYPRKSKPNTNEHQS